MSVKFPNFAIWSFVGGVWVYAENAVGTSLVWGSDGLTYYKKDLSLYALQAVPLGGLTTVKTIKTIPGSLSTRGSGVAGARYPLVNFVRNNTGSVFCYSGVDNSISFISADKRVTNIETSWGLMGQDETRRKPDGTIRGTSDPVIREMLVSGTINGVASLAILRRSDCSPTG